MKRFISGLAYFTIFLFLISQRILAQSEVLSPYPTSFLNKARLEQYTDCPVNDKITVPKAILKYLYWQDTCIEPTMIVIHFSAEWSDPDETIHILNDRGLGCHLATDGKKQLQLLDFFQNKVERAGCAAGYNNFAIHNEISGVDFDSVIANPQDGHYDELMESTKTALTTTCWLMKHYHLPLTQVFGHHEITPEKLDPGPAYMAYFRSRLKQECL